eukprot:1158300-Pelagomonas_calceolata.AAC.4
MKEKGIATYTMILLGCTEGGRQTSMYSSVSPGGAEWKGLLELALLHAYTHAHKGAVFSNEQTASTSVLPWNGKLGVIFAGWESRSLKALTEAHFPLPPCTSVLSFRAWQRRTTYTIDGMRSRCGAKYGGQGCANIRCRSVPVEGVRSNEGQECARVRGNSVPVQRSGMRARSELVWGAWFEGRDCVWLSMGAAAMCQEAAVLLFVCPQQQAKSHTVQGRGSSKKDEDGGAEPAAWLSTECTG